MTKEPEFKRGEKGYLKRFVNLFQSDAEIALNDFKSKARSSIAEVNEIKATLHKQIELVKGTIITLASNQEKIDVKLTEVNEYYRSIFKKNEEGIVVTDEIASYSDRFIEYKNEVEELKKDIDEYRKELFGSEDGKGKKIPGVEHKIQGLKTDFQKNIKVSQSEIDTFITTNSQRKDELFDKIEGLLKGASTVALAKAFKEHKDSFKFSNWIWLILFISSVGSMMALSVWGYKQSNFELENMWKFTLGNLPFIGGTIWLAIFSSKQRSQNKRLQQEYAYIEDIAKIYYGLKQEIDELGESELGKKLNESVLKLVIDVVGLNPSESLESKAHNDNGPVLEGLKSIGETIKTIKNPT